ncbi:DUF4394 domain-containing protein [Aurantimonas endophytica]|uniref:DUF4394 domain-containing protein n=1 Tax=Aurantimonas endophytica TaxID=1522175 RepID=A0A7W6HF85_9HYPH|nr:DUF4394 domain-containing protein [Aurantimonas endophytica]MBB4004119.1 hypothetical protein [Aurantimonas endophytica]MCO6404963.1 DUF4394 domain-containing protein [Aurantimonas endophytica]
MQTVKTAMIASTALFAATTAGLAAPLVGLTGDKTLVMLDTDNLAASATVEVMGVDRLVGIDWRPANDTLIGVTADNTIVTIDPETGAATELSTMDTPLEIGDAPVVVDFNPMADRLRYMTGTTNHRVNVDTGEVTVDGELAFDAADMHSGEAPAIVAAAYINSFGKPESTAMYDVDATIGALIQQTSPNDGTLAAVGKFGIAEPADTYAFDVQTSEDGTNTAWLVNGTTLYTVDLETGAATEAGAITGVDGVVRDIAAMPGE